MRESKTAERKRALFLQSYARNKVEDARAYGTDAVVRSYGRQLKETNISEEKARIEGKKGPCTSTEIRTKL